MGLNQSCRLLSAVVLLGFIHQGTAQPPRSFVAPSDSPYLSYATAPEDSGAAPIASFAPLSQASARVNGSEDSAIVQVQTTPAPNADEPDQQAPYSPTQYRQPSCNLTTPPASLSAWKRWSDPATWPGEPNIPGTNGSFSNVTISCGQFVLFDMPAIQSGMAAVKLAWLLVEGHLRFLDDPSLPLLALDSDFVIVTGNLSIGSADQHFRQKARITLTGTSKEPLPGFDDVGFKVLAAYGGQLNLYGMPGGAETPSWVSLRAIAAAGSKTLTVDQNITGWPVGSKVAISSTDFDPLQTQTATIAAASGNTLTLTQSLTNSHFAPSVPTGLPNIDMPMAAEVALLTRNILITASQEEPPLQLVGGHTMIYNTQRPQTLFGVEFESLGQQGTLGRYPVHFHMCGPMSSSIVRSNSVHDSFQRAYVIHGTHRLTARDNVAYNTTGHVFLFEDGIEQNNTLLHNLAINSQPATILIQQSGPANTDNQPACFWSASPSNSWINNTAVGCTFGFWPELNQAVRGASGGLPNAASWIPIMAPLGRFEDNTAHSNTQVGLQLYQHGYMPAKYTHFLRFKAYKNSGYGAVFHGCVKMVIDQAMIADSQTGIEFNEQSFNTIQNSIIMGYTANVGDTSACSSSTTICEPISGGCKGGLLAAGSSPSQALRTIYGSAKQGAVQYGVVLAANTAINNTFVNFNSTCHASGAIGTDNIQPGAIPVTGLLRNNVFVNTPLSSRVYIDPALASLSNQYWAARDADGSTIGGSGYLVANGSVLLLPATADSNGNSSGGPRCTSQAGWGGYSCQDVCYRSIFVQYLEPGLTALNPALGGSVLNFTRAMDSASQIMPGGNMLPYIQNAGGGVFWNRYNYVNLLGGHDYRVEFQGGSGQLPSNVTVGYTDVSQPSSSPPCKGLINLTFPAGVTVTDMTSTS